MSSLKTTGTIPSAVYLLALSLFAMGSAEFLMGGILPMIAEDLRISLPTAGTLISAFAVGALIGGPPFAILALRWPSRSALFISQVAFIVATVVSLLAQGYWSILLARFGMGLAYACFWSVAAATAVQLSPPDRRAKALSIVVSGLTVAMVFGGPAGTYISELTGWRGGFWAVIVVTVISAAAVLLALPKHTSSDEQGPDLATELRAMKRPALWVAYGTTMFTTAAYMGTFGYIAALLMDVSGLSSEWLPAVLILFGVGAFIGLTIGGRTADRQLCGDCLVCSLLVGNGGDGVHVGAGGFPVESGGVGSSVCISSRCTHVGRSHQCVGFSGWFDAGTFAGRYSDQSGLQPGVGCLGGCHHCADLAGAGFAGFSPESSGPWQIAAHRSRYRSYFYGVFIHAQDT